MIVACARQQRDFLPLVREIKTDQRLPRCHCFGMSVRGLGLAEQHSVAVITLFVLALKKDMPVLFPELKHSFSKLQWNVSLLEMPLNIYLLLFVMCAHPGHTGRKVPICRVIPLQRCPGILSRQRDNVIHSHVQLGRISFTLLMDHDVEVLRFEIFVLGNATVARDVRHADLMPFVDEERPCEDDQRQRQQFSRRFAVFRCVGHEAGDEISSVVVLGEQGGPHIHAQNEPLPIYRGPL